MMTSSRKGRRMAAVTLATAALFTAAPAFAQDASPSKLLEEFIFYANVAKPDLAAGFGQQLLDSGVTPEELAEIVDNADADLMKRLTKALERGARVDSLSEIAEAIGTSIEDGRLALARDRARIEEAIQMLGGTLREKRIGERRLAAAGEYAVPYLLRAITDGAQAEPAIADASRDILVEIGVPAISPLTVALTKVDPDTQIIICEMLEDMAGSKGTSYQHAAPALKTAALEADTEPVRRAASRAFNKIYGGDDSIDRLYTSLAENYLANASSLIAYPFERTNAVWGWEDTVGLVSTPVPTPIFNEVMAMKNAATALDYNRGNADALAVYVAANLRRENDLPKGETDLVFGDMTYTPDFYATVFGPGVGQDVLRLALDARDSALIRDAIAALAKTTGGSNLFAGGQGRPLLDSLQYPSRRVQLETALVLARALPGDSFESADRIVPLLSSAVRSGNKQYAMVIGDDNENRSVETTRLSELGFDVIASADDVASASALISGEVPGIDLVLVRMGSEASASQVIADLRRQRRTEVAPVLVVASPADLPRLRVEYRANPRTAVTRPVDGEAFELVVDDLLRDAVGGRLSDADAEVYAIESLDALKDVAINRSPAYDIRDAESTLLEALATRSGGIRMMVADILAMIDSPGAQRGLMTAALDTNDPDQVDLLERVADSVKRYGNRAEDRHVAAIVDLIENGEGDLAEGAARVHGALNRGGTDAVRFIEGG